MRPIVLRSLATILVGTVLVTACASSDEVTTPRRHQSRREPTTTTTKAGDEGRFWQRFGPEAPMHLQVDDSAVVAVGAVGEVVEYRRWPDKVMWSAKLGLRVVTRPAMSERTVAVADSDEVVAVDRRSGEVRWRVPVEKAGLVAYAGTFVVTSGYQRLVALDEQTGSTLWTLAMHGVPTAPYLSTDGTTLVFVDGSDPNAVVRSVDGAAGKIRWEHPLAGVASAAVVHGDTVVVASGSGARGKVEAFDAASGARRWVADYPGPVPALGMLPAIDDDAVAVFDGDGSVRLLDARTGELRWKTHIGDAGPFSVPLRLSPRKVLWPTYAGTLEFDRATGRHRGRPVFMGRLRDELVLGDTIVDLVDTGGYGSVELRPG